MIMSRKLARRRMLMWSKQNTPGTGEVVKHYVFKESKSALEDGYTGTLTRAQFADGKIVLTPIFISGDNNDRYNNSSLTIRTDFSRFKSLNFECYYDGAVNFTGKDEILIGYGNGTGTSFVASNSVTNTTRRVFVFDNLDDVTENGFIQVTYTRDPSISTSSSFYITNIWFESEEEPGTQEPENPTEPENTSLYVYKKGDDKYINGTHYKLGSFDFIEEEPENLNVVKTEREVSSMSNQNSVDYIQFPLSFDFTSFKTLHFRAYSGGTCNVNGIPSSVGISAYDESYKIGKPFIYKEVVAEEPEVYSFYLNDIVELAEEKGITPYIFIREYTYNNLIVTDIWFDNEDIINESDPIIPYDVTVNTGNFTFNGEDVAFKNTEYTATITAADRYEISSVTATINGNTVGSYIDDTLTIPAEKVNGNINIEVVVQEIVVEPEEPEANEIIPVFDSTRKDNLLFGAQTYSSAKQNKTYSRSKNWLIGTTYNDDNDDPGQIKLFAYDLNASVGDRTIVASSFSLKFSNTYCTNNRAVTINGTEYDVGAYTISSGEYKLCAKAYCTKSDAAGTIACGDNTVTVNSAEIAEYSMNIEIDVSGSQSPEIYFRSARGCGMFIITDIWLEKSSMESGGTEPENPISHNITRNLTNITSDNQLNKISHESSYGVTLTPYDGYEITSIVITMSGIDITESCRIDSDGYVRIDNITGDIIITAVAELIEASKPAISSILNENSWETIAEVTKAGLAPSYWSVGQGKEVQINGTVAGTNLSGTYYAFILGFNHNPDIEGNNTIHFCIGSTEIDSEGMRAGYEVIFSGYNAWNLTDKTGEFCMNLADSTTGGWEKSYMRNTICEDFYSILPNDLQSVIKPCAKATLTMQNAGGLLDQDEYALDVIENNKLFLLGHKEVLGSDVPEGNLSSSKQEQYSYYTNNLNITKKNANPLVSFGTTSQAVGTTSNVAWWLRDVAYNNRYNFLVMSSGSANSSESELANASRGFVPCFVIG